MVATPEALVEAVALPHLGDEEVTSTPGSKAPDAVADALTLTLTVVPETTGVGVAERP